MTRDTINAIAILLSLFTDQEREDLKIRLGTREITLEQQFVGRWYNARPRYVGDIFLYKAAHIINGNRALFLRAIEFEKPEFQAKLHQILSDPDSYIKIKETKTDNKDTQKGVTVGQVRSSGLSRAFNKHRSGLTESGQEYLDLEQVWESDDLNHLRKGLSESKLEASVSIDQDKPGLDGISVSLLTRDKQPLNWNEPNKVDINRGEDMPLQSITINQSRAQGMTETDTNTLGVNDQMKNLDGKSVTKDKVTIEALQLMTATKIKSPRETAFQKLDVLFSSCQ